VPDKGCQIAKRPRSRPFSNLATFIGHKLFIAVKQSIVGWTTSVEPNVESKKEAGHEIQSRLAW
jgi:hypothetical protein